MVFEEIKNNFRIVCIRNASFVFNNLCLGTRTKSKSKSKFNTYVRKIGTLLVQLGWAEKCVAIISCFFSQTFENGHGVRVDLFSVHSLTIPPMRQFLRTRGRIVGPMPVITVQHQTFWLNKSYLLFNQNVWCWNNITGMGPTIRPQVFKIKIPDAKAVARKVAYKLRKGCSLPCTTHSEG